MNFMRAQELIDELIRAGATGRISVPITGASFGEAKDLAGTVEVDLRAKTGTVRLRVSEPLQLIRMDFVSTSPAAAPTED